MSLREITAIPRRIAGAAKLLLIASWVLGLLAIKVNVVAPLMARRIFNDFAANPHPPIREVNTAVGLSLLALVVSALIMAAVSYANSYMTERATNVLTLDIYRRLIRFSPAFFQGQEVERINNRALNDTSAVAGFWLAVVSGVPLALVSIGYYGWMLVGTNHALGVCALALSPLTGYFLLLDRRVQAVNRHALEVSDRIRVTTGEVVGGVEELRQGGNFEHAMGTLATRFEESRRVATEISILRSIFAAMGPLVVALQNGTIQWLGAAAAAGVLLTRYGAMTWGDVVAFLGILALFQTPVRTIAGFIMEWRMAQEKIQRVKEYLDHPEVFRSAPGAPDLGTGATIRFEGVEVVVPGGKKILSGVSLGIAPGQHVAMVGPAGSGKSTTIQLLARNTEATQGRIMLAGKPLEDYSLGSLVRRIGFVPQKAVLFNTSIRNNILLGLRRPSERGFMDSVGWLDTSSLPEVSNLDSLDQRLVDVLRMVALEEDVFRKALDIRGAAGSMDFLRGACPGLRKRAAECAQALGLGLVPFASGACFPGTVGENLLGPGFDSEKMAGTMDLALSEATPPGFLKDLLDLGFNRYATENFLARRVAQRAPGLLPFLPTQQRAGAQPGLSASLGGMDLATLPRPMRELLLEFALECTLDEELDARVPRAFRQDLLGARRAWRSSRAAQASWDLVDQGAFLDAVPLRDNLLGGRVPCGLHECAEKVEKMVRDLLKEQGIYERILVAGLDTDVGEWGKQLSGGQRQKVAIARVMLKNPDILLMDEATASLDELSQARVVDLVRKRFAGHTVVSISHRLSTVQDSHQIVVLDRGRIVQQGDYPELVAVPGLFRELVGQQMGGLAALPSQEPRKAALPPPPLSGGKADVVRQLSLVPLFASLDEARLSFLAQVAQVVQAPAGTVLYERGDPGGELFVILQGKVAFFSGSEVVTTYGAGRAFGEVAIFGAGIRTLGARVAEDALFCVLGRQHLYQLIEADSGLAVGLLEGLARRMTELTEERFPTRLEPGAEPLLSSPVSPGGHAHE